MKKVSFILIILAIILGFVSCTPKDEVFKVVNYGGKIIAIAPIGIDLTAVNKGTEVTFKVLVPQGEKVTSFKVNSIETALPENNIIKLTINETTILDAKIEARVPKIIWDQGELDALSISSPENLNLNKIEWGTEVTVKIDKPSDKSITRFEVNNQDKIMALSANYEYTFNVIEDENIISLELSDPCVLTLANTNLSILEPEGLDLSHITKGTEVRIKATLEDNKAIEKLTLTTDEGPEDDSDIVYKYEEINDVYEIFVEKIFTVEEDCELNLTFHSEQKVLPAEYYEFDSYSQKVRLLKKSIDNSFTNMLIPNCVNVIKLEAFKEWNNLVSLEIPSSVTEIEKSAFHSCSLLENILMVNGLIKIEQYAFYNCNNLENITFPENLKNIFIGMDAFSKTKWLDYKFKENDGVATINNAIVACKSEKEGDFSIPNNITTICSNAFSSSNLTNIFIPDSVEFIGEKAFYSCQNITSITLSNNITEIEDKTFYNCYKLESIIIPDRVRYIGKLAFYKCESLNSIEIPNSVEEIDEFAFNNCSSLNSITIPESVLKIGRGVFLTCNDLHLIKCEASSKPYGWNNNWNVGNIPVDWYPWE